MNEAPHVVLGDRLQTTKRRPRRVLSGTSRPSTLENKHSYIT